MQARGSTVVEPAGSAGGGAAAARQAAAAVPEDAGRAATAAPPPPLPPWLRDSLSGACGALCLVAVGAPLDVAKLRLQAAPGAYRGTLAALSHMARGEGAASLWKGSAPALASAVIENAVSFAAHGAARRLLVGAAGDEASVTPAQQALIGGGAGALSAAAICPAEVVKCRMQLQGLGGAGRRLRYRSSLHCARALLREEGARAAFAGLRALWLRDVPFNFLFFGAYRGCTVALCALTGAPTPAHGDVPAWMAVISGGAAGAAAWAAVYPFDVLKSRAQVAGMAAATVPTAAPPPPLLASLRAIVREVGVRGLYAGASAAIARGAVANAALFWGQNLGVKGLAYLFGGGDAGGDADR